MSGFVVTVAWLFVDICPGHIEWNEMREVIEEENGYFDDEDDDEEK